MIHLSARSLRWLTLNSLQYRTGQDLAEHEFLEINVNIISSNPPDQRPNSCHVSEENRSAETEKNILEKDIRLNNQSINITCSIRGKFSAIKCIQDKNSHELVSPCLCFNVNHYNKLYEHIKLYMTFSTKCTYNNTNIIAK